MFANYIVRVTGEELMINDFMTNSPVAPGEPLDGCERIAIKKSSSHDAFNQKLKQLPLLINFLHFPHVWILCSTFFMVNR